MKLPVFKPIINKLVVNKQEELKAIDDLIQKARNDYEDEVRYNGKNS